MRLRTTVVQFLVFTIVGLVMFSPTLDAPWHFDDLHLVQSFSSSLLRAAWTRNWDFDNAETPGFRPVTPLFNHVRYSILGESRLAHRVASLVMFALYLVLIGCVAARLGTSQGEILLAGAFTLCNSYSFWHVSWITDGNHQLQGLAIGLAAIIMVYWVEHGGPWLLVPAAVLPLIAMLTREDSMEAFPLVIVPALVYASMSGRLVERGKGFLAHAIALVTAMIVLLIWRHHFVPEAMALALDPRGYLSSVMMTLRFGNYSLPGDLSLLSAGVMMTALPRLANDERKSACLWLGLTLLACSHGFVWDRGDLHYFSASFYSLFCVTIVSSYWRRRGVVQAVTTAAVVLFLIAGLRSSWYQQKSTFSRPSEIHLAASWRMVHGYDTPIQMTPERRAAVEAELEEFGLNSPDPEAFRQAVTKQIDPDQRWRLLPVAPRK